MNSTIIQRAPRVFGAAALFGALLIAPVSASAATMANEPPTITGQACAGEDGVTVVVDFSDLGGEVEIACAEGSPANGREVLESAGFTPEDSMPGMVCTINSQPDPCPEEFDGNFWAYWVTGDSGEWEMSMVGLDEAVPEPGSVEAWRYSDGSEGPAIEPAAAAEFSGAESAEGEDAPEPSADDSAGLPTWAAILIGVGIIGAIAAMIARRKNV